MSTEFQTLKSTYRVLEDNNSFYIQEKCPLIGWGYSQTMDLKGKDAYPWWFNLLMVTFLILVAALILSLCFLAIYYIMFTLFALFTDGFLLYLIPFKVRYYAFKFNSINSAEDFINSIVNSSIAEKKALKAKKEAKANRKYHYFLTVKQQRKEKLKKLNK